MILVTLTKNDIECILKTKYAPGSEHEITITYEGDKTILRIDHE